MADKFIIEGAAFNGDGTSSAEATVAGGVGAWNTITYFEGATPAYGSLAAGDRVYIRSKTAAGANITRTLAASVTLGLTSATALLPVIWVLDYGVVWAGVNGALRYEAPSTFIVTALSYNPIIAGARDVFQIIDVSQAAQKAILTLGAYGYIKNLLVDCSGNTFYQASRIATQSGSGGRPMLENLHFLPSKSAYQYCIAAQSGQVFSFVNPDIELMAGHSPPIFKPSIDLSSFEIIGGKISGPGATTGATLADLSSTYTGTIKGYGFQFPKTITMVTSTFAGASANTSCAFIGIDGGSGVAIAEDWGEADSRNDGFYPTLNAFLPDSAQTPWSWRLYPSRAGLDRPSRIIVGKYYTQDPATKTITLEFLAADTIAGLNRYSAYIEVHYVDDTTGAPAYVSSRGWPSEALTVSSAPWSILTWGAIGLVRRSVSVATPTTIKKDSLVTVVFRALCKTTSANDVLFICPDPVIT